jgi:pimeloyl-ACP methyl ester carboxylesterase
LPKVKVGDIDIYYELHGDGFPLVMIMGLSGNIDWWDPRLIQETSKRYKTVIFDNRGAGRTDKPKVAYTIKMFADDTADLMDALKIKRAHILGHSMGGMIAQEFALSHPDKVEKLVLCSTFCGGSNSVQASPQVLGLLMSPRPEGMTDEDVVKHMIPILFTEDFVKSDPSYISDFTQQLLKAPTPDDAYRRQLGASLNFGIYERLPEIKAVTMVMHGKKDILMPPENAKIIADKIPGAKLVYFENSAHALFSQEPEKVNKALLEFLK